MSRFYAYTPEQGYLLPPNVGEELGEDHLCFFVRRVVRQLDLRVFSESYGPAGGMLMPRADAGSMAIRVCDGDYLSPALIAAVGGRSRTTFSGWRSPGGHWALSAFRRRHALALNNAFTQVLEMARSLGLGKLGRVAIDSTRIKANASPDRVDTEQTLRNERAKLRRNIRRWQQTCDKDDTEPAGLTVAIGDAERKLAELPQRLERLRKSGREKLSRTDTDARFLRCRRGFQLGYSGEIAMSEDHLIVAQRVTQESTDNALLAPMVEQVKLECGSPPEEVLADSGYFSIKNLEWLEEQKINACLPDSNMARSLNLGKRCKGRARAAAHKRMRQKLRIPQEDKPMPSARPWSNLVSEC